MTDTSVEYSNQQQLIILWWCLGAGGFLSTIIFCCCLAVNKYPKNIRYNPPPLFSSAHNAHSLPLQTVTTSAAQQAAAKLFESAKTAQQPPLSADSPGHSSLPQQSVSEPTVTQQPAGISQHLQLTVLQSADSSSANVVQEMMMFSHQALLHAGHLPSSAVSPLELNTRPPADVFAATEEMLMYTNAVLESMSMTRPHSSATTRLPSRQLLVPISNAPDVSMVASDSS